MHLHFNTTCPTPPRRRVSHSLAGILALGIVLPLPKANADVAHGQKGIVASVNPLATQAGINAMKNGGNAIDAAVAVGLTLGVVDGFNSGIGGGCFMLIHRANGENIALDGREMAPDAATRDMFIRDGKADTNLSQTGALASGIPGSLAVYERALNRYGRRSLADAILPAADIAANGFALPADYIRRLGPAEEALKKFESSRAVLLKPNGESYKQGDVLKQPDLARSYRAIAKQGAKWFYKGEFGKAVETWMKSNGGIITAADFVRYSVRQRQPISTTYRGYQIVSFPPPSSGGVHVGQMLNILQNFNLAKLPEADRVHVVAEAMKLAFADRAYWLGDPDYTKVPRGLVAPSYGKDLAARIRLDKTTVVTDHGTPPDFNENVFEKHTTHFSTADAEGNWVACTSTVNNTFGSKVIVPGTGIVLNDQMDDFSVQPGVPNSFQLVGAEANSVAAGKRPLSSMSPTIVMQGKQPILSLGAAGGPTIITQTLINIIGVLDLHLPLDKALAQSRYHQQWTPDELRIEKSMPEAVKAVLRAKGHTLREVTGIGASQIVGRDAVGFVGASEPRVSGLALGW